MPKVKILVRLSQEFRCRMRQSVSHENQYSTFLDLLYAVVYASAGPFDETIVWIRDGGMLGVEVCRLLA